MKRMIVAAVVALALATSGVIVAQQTGTPLTGQFPGGAINQTNFNQNTDSTGFNESSLTPSLAVPSGSTAQAAFNTDGSLKSGTVITTKVTMITTCSGTTGVTLPALQRYTPITIINRSGGSCLVWPSIGATVETALGTDGATNASFTQLTNTDVIYKPVSATKWVQ